MFIWIIIHGSYNSPEKRIVHFLRRCPLLYGLRCKSSDLLRHGTGMHMRGLRVSWTDTPRWLRFLRLWLPFLALSPSTFEFHAIVVLEGCRLRPVTLRDPKKLCSLMRFVNVLQNDRQRSPPRLFFLILTELLVKLWEWKRPKLSARHNKLTRQR